MVWALQFKLPGVAILAVGGVVFCTTVAVVVAAQPVVVAVIVTVYVPGFCTLIFGVVAVNPPGPVQEKVAGEALVVVATCTLVALQVKGPAGTAEAVGGVLFCSTVATAVAEQPVDVEVIVTI